MNGIPKQAGTAMLTFDKANFKTKGIKQATEH